MGVLQELMWDEMEEYKVYLAKKDGVISRNLLR